MTGAVPNVAAPRETPVANPLFEYVLRISDDRLVLGHRLSEWCGHGPILEEDIALSNIALDFIGQASALLALAGRIEGAGRDEDALAYFRDERDFRNCLLVEQPNGDFGATIVRQFLFDAQMQPHRAKLEPAAAPGSQGHRLFDFDHAQDAAIEGARRILATRRHGELHVVDRGDHAPASASSLAASAPFHSIGPLIRQTSRPSAS